MCTEGDWSKLLRNSCSPTVSHIFDDLLEDGRYVRPGAQTRSLGTITNARKFDVEIDDAFGKRRFLLKFTDDANKRYQLPINDLTFGEYLRTLVANSNETKAESLTTGALSSADEVYLRIGLARPIQLGDYPKACWTQVTGIYTFPDYLRGKTLADFY